MMDQKQYEKVLSTVDIMEFLRDQIDSTVEIVKKQETITS